MKSVLQSIISPGNKQLAVLVDPDKHNEESLDVLCKAVRSSRVSFFFVGGSLLLKENFESTILHLKSNTDIPVVIFPGSKYQVSHHADAMLFISLLSGRNPEYLIGQQVAAAGAVKASGIEVIPTAYLLIDGGRVSTTTYITQTIPIPNNKPDIAAATALAGEMMGMRLVYLEAGSGALQTVSPEIIAAVKSAVSIPVVVGGGIQTSYQAKAIWDAGADLIVIGNALENNPELLASIMQ